MIPYIKNANAKEHASKEEQRKKVPRKMKKLSSIEQRYKVCIAKVTKRKYKNK